MASGRLRRYPDSPEGIGDYRGLPDIGGAQPVAATFVGIHNHSSCYMALLGLSPQQCLMRLLKAEWPAEETHLVRTHN